LQEALNQKWVDYFAMVAKAKKRYIAKNTEQFYAQWLYKKYATVTESTPGQVIIDNTKMPDEVYASDLLSNLLLKVQLRKGQHVSSILLNGQQQRVYYEEGGYGMIILPKLDQARYRLEFTLSDKEMPTYVRGNGTYNIYGFSIKRGKARLRLRMYGTQEVTIVGIPKSRKIKSDNRNLKVIKRSYDAKTRTLHLLLQAHDIQGETATLAMEF